MTQDTFYSYSRIGIEFSMYESVWLRGLLNSHNPPEMNKKFWFTAATSIFVLATTDAYLVPSS